MRATQNLPILLTPAASGAAALRALSSLEKAPIWTKVPFASELLGVAGVESTLGAAIAATLGFGLGIGAAFSSGGAIVPAISGSGFTDFGV